jgi:hypothetical protein
MKVRELATDVLTGETLEHWVDMPGVLDAEQAQAATFERLADEARAERTTRLASCDWTMLPDAPITDAQRTAWTAYREALRDVTNQPGFPAVIDWPAQPA